MALDNPVVNISAHGVLRNTRLLELGVVVALTVAVVVVAALWGTSSDSTDPLSVGALDSPVAAPADRVGSDASELANSSASVEANAALRVAENQASEIPAVSAAVEHDAGDLSTPVQTGVVPGRPDPIEPSLPRSFERYQVQRGESLFAIAAARGVTVSDLVQWNWHLEDDSTLIRGEWIWIPQWDAHAVADEAAEPSDEGKSGRGGG